MKISVIILFLATVTQHSLSQVMGTGFYIDGEGTILTCAHCVDGANEIKILERGGYAYKAKVKSIDTKRDIAVLKINKRDSIYLKIHKDDLKLLEDIKVIGFPLPNLLGNELNASTGEINSIRNLIGYQYIQIDAAINPGNSGGPVLNKKNNAIGVVLSKLDPQKTKYLTGDSPERINFALANKEIVNWLDTNGINYTPASTADTVPLNIAKNAIVQVISFYHNDTNTAQKNTEEVISRAAYSYVMAGSSPNIEAEIAHYDTLVDYYDYGIVNKEFIKKNLQELRGRYPIRKYNVININNLDVNSKLNIAAVDLSLQYILSNNKRDRVGKARTLIVFNLNTGKVILCKEERSEHK